MKENDDTSAFLGSRNVGIDFLKIIAMYLIVLGHLLNEGGVLDAFQHNTKYILLSCIAAIIRPGVDCYALITGWGGYKEKEEQLFSNRRILKYLNYWLQVVVTGTIILVINLVITKKFAFSDFLTTIFPVTRRAYWYFTAYSITFFISPILNKMIKRINREQEYIIIAFVVLIGMVGSFFKSGSFFAKALRVLWVVLLYCIGAIIKKRGRAIKNSKIVKRIFLLFITSSIGAIFIDTRIKGVLPIYADSLFTGFFSPIILCIAASSIQLFSAVDIKRIKLVKTISSTTFGVYIIHSNFILQREYFVNRFGFIGEMHPLLLLIVSVLIACSIFTLCSLLELVRISGFSYIEAKISEQGK